VGQRAGIRLGGDSASSRPDQHRSEAHRDLIDLRLDDQAAKLRELLPGLVDQAVGKTLTSVQASQDRLRADLDKHLRELD
jgi:hypothetical protein